MLTTSQAADILKINENTLNALAGTGQIPCARISSAPGGGPQIRFNTLEITDWLSRGLILAMNDKAYIERWSQRLEKQFPEQLAALREYDKHFIAPRKPKGYNLTKVANKKLGFVYHVRYIEKGKLVPTRWSSHTNDYDAAARFAVENREKLLAEYYQNKTRKKISGSLYTLFKHYYEKDSPYQKANARRGKSLSEQARGTYHCTILKHWIPFLKKHRIKLLDEIDTPLLVKFQDYCLEKGIKPQTANTYISHISNIFDYLVLRGNIKINPCNGLTLLGVNEEHYHIRGCYKIAELRGVFNKRWKDAYLQMLCLIIYTTNMRNSDIEKIQVKDIIRIKDCRFIDIPKSKTKNGVRIVPLHDFVYGMLIRYIKKTGKGPDDYVFTNGKRIAHDTYNKANITLGAYAGYDEARLKEENITFYSGRHFWKTMMNSADLGEVEEYFMGHKISSDVAKRYNHRDKQGQDKIVKKAQEVFRILDKTLFAAQR